MDPRILLVDDDAYIRELEQLRLGRLGCDVTVCSSANEVLQAIREAPDCYDLVITAHSIRGATGLQVARTLQREGYEGPIVLVLHNDWEIDAAEAQAEGVDTVLVKPVTMAEYESVLDALL